MINRAALEAEIMLQARKSAEVRKTLDDLGKEVVEFWRSQVPVRTGKYGASVKVLKTFTANGLPGIKVGSTSNRAHLIEFGTGSDTDGKEPRYVPSLGVQVTKDTPTPAYAPRAKTAKHFNGDEAPARKDDTTPDINLDEADQ